MRQLSHGSVLLPLLSRRDNQAGSRPSARNRKRSERISVVGPDDAARKNGVRIAMGAPIFLPDMEFARPNER